MTEKTKNQAVDTDNSKDLSSKNTTSFSDTNKVKGTKNTKTSAMKKYKSKKMKKIIKTIIIVLFIALIALFAAKKIGLFDKQNDLLANQLTTYTVSKRTITEIIESTGTIVPNDEYNVTPLVTGEILEDYFEEGDTVLEDQPLYLIDSESGDSRITQLTNAVEKAEKQLENARESLEDLYIKSNVSGTIEEIHVEVGDEIKQGQILADVTDKDTMLIDIPFFDVDISGGKIRIGSTAEVMLDVDKAVIGYVESIAPTTNPNSNGTAVRNVTIAVRNNGAISNTTTAISASVGEYTSNAGGTFEYNDSGSITATYSGEIVAINYREGQRISKDAYFLTLSDEDIQDNIEDLENNVEDALLNLEDAQEELDNYKIKAPKSGKIVTKSYKKGDTVSGGAASGSLAIIYDMSALKFTMSIDELDIDKLEEGQEVIITCDSRAGKEYYGTITNISILGTTTNGTTTYPVEVTIDNVEDENMRTVDENGVIHKVYKTGMTSTTGTYKLLNAQDVDDGKLYTYEDGTEILHMYNGELYNGSSQLKEYGESYVEHDNYYTFNSDFSQMTLEKQNTKEMLRIAMNVDAQIVVEKHENVIAVPISAVGRGDTVKLLKNAGTEVPVSEENNATSQKNASPSEETNKSAEKTRDFPYGAVKSNYGTADEDSEYLEVRVTTGASDDDYIEITSGLNEGDIIIIDNSNLESSQTAMPFAMMGGGMQGGMGGGMTPPGGGFSGGGGIAR